MKRPIKVGLIGTGIVACKEHLPAIRKAGGVVVALADLDIEKARAAAAEFGIPEVYASHRDLIENSDVDMIAICTGPAAHSEIALDAIAAGKHLYIEKPPTQSAAQISAVVKAANQKNLLIWAGSHHPGRENVQRLKKEIDSGNLGEIYAIDCLKLRHHQTPRDSANFTLRGGVSSGSAVHRIDIALFLLDNPAPTSVTATTSNHFVRKITPSDDFSGLIDDTLIATINFSNGVTLTIRDLGHAHLPQPNTNFWWFGDFSVFGTEQAAILHPLTIYRAPQDGDFQAISPHVNNSLDHGHDGIYRILFDCLHQGTRPPMAAERSILLMRILDAIHASAAQGGKQITFIYQN